MNYKNKDLFKPKYSELDIEIREFGGTAIFAHPFYEWVVDNINTIEDKLLYSVMSNIVPLGNDGRTYFMHLAANYEGSLVELMNLYATMEKLYNSGFIRTSAYHELYELGYKGHGFDGCCPVAEVLDFIQESEKEMGYGIDISDHELLENYS